MGEKICECAKRILDGENKLNAAQKQINDASIECDTILKQKCKAYEKICNDIEKFERKSNNSCNRTLYAYVEGLKTSKLYLANWILEKYCLDKE